MQFYYFLKYSEQQINQKPFCSVHWLLVAPHCYKIINQQNLNHSFFLPLLEFCHFRKKIWVTFFFWWKIKFSVSFRFWAQVLKKVFRGLLPNHDIQWVKWTKIPHIHTKLFVLGSFWGVRKWRNSIFWGDETKIFIYKVPFTPQLCHEYIYY